MPVRVLLADDTPDIRALLRIMLSRYSDFEVVGEAADGRQAVDLARAVVPDLLLLDLAMPVMDGLQAIPHVRAAAPDCKIVVLSGFNAEQMAGEAIGAGADAYVEKGAPPSRLVNELRRVLGRPEHEPPPTPNAQAPTDTAWDSSELSIMTHELMSPLAVIEGFASLMECKSEILTPEQVRDQAGSILRSARHLRALLQAVTDAHRLEVRDFSLARETVDLVGLVKELVKDLSAIIDGHAVVVTAPDELSTPVDPTRVRQVLTNLISNAAKFSPPSSPIEVHVTAADGEAEVSVRDYGPGISPERRHELFHRFSRLGTTAKGMGLGLFISRGIARAHGGDLVLDQDVSPGARFVLRLPR